MYQSLRFSKSKLVADELALIAEYSSYQINSIFKERQKHLLDFTKKLLNTKVTSEQVAVLFVRYKRQRSKIWLTSDIQIQKAKYTRLKTKKENDNNFDDNWRMYSTIITALNALETCKRARQTNDVILLTNLVGSDSITDCDAIDELEVCLQYAICKAKRNLK